MSATVENPTSVGAEPAAQRFLPVHIDSLDPQILDLDIWLRHEGKATPALYKAAGVEVTLIELQRLKRQKIEYVYIPAHQHVIYRGMVTRKLDRLFAEPGKAAAARATIIRDNCAKMIEDVLLLPGQTEPIETIAEIGKTFQTWVAKDKSQFGFLLDMSSHDFYTTTHMVNVGVGCGLLVRALRPGDEEVFGVAVQGGLLHDVGKRGIDPDILNKAGKLDPDEWEILRRHPSLGYEELVQHPAMPHGVLEMTRDHHERLDGSGYPAGRLADDIGFLARVCAVVDVFDAITAARPYRGPTHPRDALLMMADGVGTQFDPQIFERWRALVEELLHEAPERVGGAREGKVPAGPILPQPPAAAPAAPPSHADAERPASALGDRRVYPRFACSTLVEACFVEQSRRHPVNKAERFPLRLVDISRGGVCAEADWPFARGEVLFISLPGANGAPVTRYARVVRVRGGTRGKWLIGLSFIESPGS